MQWSLKILAEADKAVPAFVEWAPHKSGKLELLSPLSIDDLVIEGLFFRAVAFENLADRDVTFQLEYHGNTGAVSGQAQMIRIDWNPTHKHTNDGKAPKRLRFREITGSHLHGFDYNWVEAENRMRSGNLPVAERIDADIPTFYDLLDFAGKELRIKGLDSLLIPEWTSTLF